MRWLGFAIVTCGLSAALPFGAAAQEAGAVVLAATATAEAGSLEAWFVYGIPVVAIIISLYYVTKILSAVGAEGGWSIAKALSEKVTTSIPMTNLPLPAFAGDAGGNLVVQTPTQFVVYEPSSSRLIAFMGTIIILIIFSGFGLVAMVRFGLGHETTGLKGIVTYLVAGMGFFAPYALNKTAEVLKRFSGNP